MRPAPIELRLALVCYGGVSLTVYMHGITKELHKLVAASRQFDRSADVDAPNPFADDPAAWDSEHVYYEALRTLARSGAPRSVAIDVISGTSAGGINGIVLAKVLALDGAQDELRRVWIEEGDLRRLLRAPALGGLPLQVLLTGLAVLCHWKKPTSPLRGERMSALLLRAMADIDMHASGGTLLPEAGTLDLYVTTTDLHGFEIVVHSGTGGASQRDRVHAQVLHFRGRHGDTAQFGPAGTPALAFAGRATSSFPGAFAPVSLASFATEIGAALDTGAVTERFQHSYEEHGYRAGGAWFVDGGLLDNAPFDLVVEAVSHKRAESQVLRRIVYIQPDPGRPLGEAQPPNGSQEPGWLQALWQAYTSVQGSHSILRDLRALQEMNTRIAEVGAITDRSMAEVTAHVQDALEAIAAPDRAEPDRHWDRGYVQRLSDEMHRRAAAALGPGSTTYVRLKVEAAGRRLADEVALRFGYPPDSGRSSFVRAALSAWARSAPEWMSPDQTELLRNLGPVDVPYRERRLLFLLAGVNALYVEPGGPPRADLDGLKRVAWDLLENLRRLPGVAVADLPEEVVDFLAAVALDPHRYDDPARFAAAHRAEFANVLAHYRDALDKRLGDGSTPLWQAYRTVTADWAPDTARQLLGRYLGFPLWDGLIFPVVALAQLPQYTPMEAAQFSPRTAVALPTPPGGKLKGVGLHHFAAFFEAGWRENDYLWGRLDGVELILRTLFAGTGGIPDAGVDQTPDSASDALRGAGGQHLVDGLRTVLASETNLHRVATLRATLTTQVDRLDELAGSLHDPARTGSCGRTTDPATPGPASRRKRWPPPWRPPSRTPAA